MHFEALVLELYVLRVSTHRLPKESYCAVPERTYSSSAETPSVRRGTSPHYGKVFTTRIEEDCYIEDIISRHASLLTPCHQSYPVNQTSIWTSGLHRFLYLLIDLLLPWAVAKVRSRIAVLQTHATSSDVPAGTAITSFYYKVFSFICILHLWFLTHLLNLEWSRLPRCSPHFIITHIGCVAIDADYSQSTIPSSYLLLINNIISALRRSSCPECLRQIKVRVV